MLLRAQLYDYSIFYQPGTTIPVADALSRAPISHSEPEEETFHNLTHVHVKEKQCTEIREASTDEEMSKLKETIISGWPVHKDDVPKEIRSYFPYRDELTVQDGVVIHGERLVVPKSLRTTMTI